MITLYRGAEYQRQQQVDGDAVVPIKLLKRELDAERDRVKSAGVSVETTTLSGRAAPEIVAHAKKTGADLIVMGTHGRSGFQHAILGSVAERVLRHSPCPVLVVPVRQAPG